MISFSKIRTRFRKNEDGATALEFAFVIPIVLMTIFGILNLGVFFLSTHKAQFATEKAARKIRLIDNPSEAKILEILKAEVGKPVSGTYRFKVTRIADGDDTYADMKVSYAFNLSVPLLDSYTFKSEPGARILLRDFSEYN